MSPIRRFFPAGAIHAADILHAARSGRAHRNFTSVILHITDITRLSADGRNIPVLIFCQPGQVQWRKAECRRNFPLCAVFCNRIRYFSNRFFRIRSHHCRAAYTDGSNHGCQGLFHRYHINRLSILYAILYDIKKEYSIISDFKS